jgi:sulfur-oxidizing protein SoxX
MKTILTKTLLVKTRTRTGLTFLAVMAALMATPAVTAQQTPSDKPNTLAAGKAIAFDRNAGNCLSCHMMDDGELPGNSAPPLLQMKLRFPDRVLLRAQIWDATVKNPSSVMPPYGRNLVLSEQEIDLVVDYVLSL